MSIEKRIPVHVGKGYDVLIGRGLLDSAGDLLKELFPDRRALVVSETTVAPLYLSAVMNSLENAGIDAASCIFPAGEGSKNLDTFGNILESAAKHRLTRKDYMVALGGGVCGDMTGFAAGCYMRGIPFVQIPTTVLSMVDSSVGGKCAVDLQAGKNMAGVFHQPSLVLCDLETLDTLRPEVYADGLAEAVKTGILTGGTLFKYFMDSDPSRHISEIISACILYKAGVVERDEKELGERKFLNLGHTPGHAIEKCSGYSVMHGHAVAIGTAIMARACAKEHISSAETADRIESALLNCGLPVRTSFSADELLEAARTDKKSSGSTISVILPVSIGKCQIREMDFETLYALFKLGIE